MKSFGIRLWILSIQRGYFISTNAQSHLLKKYHYFMNLEGRKSYKLSYNTFLSLKIFLHNTIFLPSRVFQYYSRTVTQTMDTNPASSDTAPCLIFPACKQKKWQQQEHQKQSSCTCSDNYIKTATWLTPILTGHRL